jgi:glutamine---fructose-6-phosphate transaminase (isomerizing)
MAGEATLKEIAEQFDVWAGLIEDFELLRKDVAANFEVKEFDDIIFTGAGSSYHLAAAAAASFRFVAGEMAYAFPSSELLFFNKYNLKRERKYIVVLFSRSGRTPETLETLELLRKQHRVAAVGISCDPDSQLCAKCDMALPVKNCVEESIIMTKSFTSMLFVSHMFAIALGEKLSNAAYLEQFPDEGRASFEMNRRVMDRVVAEAQLDRITVLGGGPFLGLAREAGLKLDEMALLRSQVLSPLELRHGPRAAIGKNDLVVFFMSNSARELELGLLREVKDLGAKTLVLSDKKEKEYDLLADYLVLTGRGLPEQYRGVLYLPFIQYLGARAAVERGINPDAPLNLSRVVTF